MYDTAKGNYDTKKTEWDTKTTAKSTAAQIKTKINAVLVTATTAINENTNGTVAKTLKDEKATMVTKTSALATAAGNW